MRVAVTKHLWVGEDDDTLFCETADAAAYFLELPTQVRVMVADFDTADRTLSLLGVDDRSRSLLLAYARTRWQSGYPD